MSNRLRSFRWPLVIVVAVAPLAINYWLDISGYPGPYGAVGNYLATAFVMLLALSAVTVFVVMPVYGICRLFRRMGRKPKDH